jgi:two-component system sensor histidine kinase BaeS
VVGDLAELSSAEAAGRTMALDRMEPVDLAALAAEECAAREAQLRAADLVLTTRLGRVPAVHGDPHRLHQVVGNLLENCIRHCRPGDRVEVGVDLVGPRAPGPAGMAGPSPAVRLVVADTGPGIAPDDLPHVLTRFWRSAQARNRSAGSGLGLAITAELVRAHQGTIEVTSPGGQADGTGSSGTTVTVLLPTTPGGR